jgi:hypothetical protein
MKDSRLTRAGVAGFNQPKRTPSHPTKSHVVVAKVGSQIKTIRFGQQGVSGSPKKQEKLLPMQHEESLSKQDTQVIYPEVK